LFQLSALKDRKDFTMFRIKKKETPEMSIMAVPKLAIISFATLVASAVALTVFCFFYVYFFGCAHQLGVLAEDENPVETITETIELETSLLGQFGLSRVLCTACAHVIVGGLL